jgi:hypothetical protein
MNDLEECNGPACPKCGCRDSQILAYPQPGVAVWYGAGRARCKHCSFVFHFKELPTDAAVEHPTLRCSQCGGTDTVVTSTRGRVRHNKCRGCGKAFKTVEKSEDPPEVETISRENVPKVTESITRRRRVG